jgi:ubiquinone/menaquinone biosynthesis C-methylase UbiE
MTMREFLDYYYKYKTIPVVNISDFSLKKIYDQRDFFYYKLGINPHNFENKKVIEFCPGNGVNAHYLINKVKIKKITLVDNNPSSILNLKKNLSKFNNVSIKNIDLKKFYTNEKFDIVILENALPGFKNPKKILNKLLNICNPGGVIITTLTDEVGIFSEKLRFVLAKKILKNTNEEQFKNNLKILSGFFKSHLASLKTKTRRVDKWVLDNILHEDWIKKNKYFNLINLYSVLKKTNSYFISSMSPKLGPDYDWYKKSTIKKHNYNFIKSYQENQINLLNFGEEFSSKHHPICKDIIKEISKVSKVINKLNFSKKLSDKKNYIKINNILIIIISKLNKIKKDSNTSKAIKEFINFRYQKMKYFKIFWGRTTNSVAIFKTKKNGGRAKVCSGRSKKSVVE